MDDLKLGFLSYCPFEKGAALRGAMLVTDSRLKPLEFRITSCIKPTKFQKSLYGKILNGYILVDLITLPILASLSSRPRVILVRNPLFLGANKEQDTAVLRLYKKGEPSVSRNGTIYPLNNNGSTTPLYIETSKNMKDPMKTMAPVVENIAKEYNLLEPFDRIILASQQVHNQGVEKGA